MRLLLVEDKRDFAADFETAVRAIQGCELVWVGSRDRALERLAAEHFDLIVLDRRIPTADDVLDDHHEHGWAVFLQVRERLPGTPVWFLTGTEDGDFATEMNNDFGRAGDMHGRGQPEAMYLVWWKRRITDCVRRIREFAFQQEELNRIAVRVDARAAGLRPQEFSVLRLFGRRYHGAAIDLTPLNGGRSRSRVLKVVVRNANGDQLITAAAKVSPLEDISDEARRYRTDVTRLAPGGFPQLTETIDVGAGNYGGLFYGMVGDVVETLFDRIASGHAELARVPREIHAIEAPWYQTKRMECVRVSQIRRQLIGDTAFHDVLAQLGGIDIAPIEARVVRAGRCCQHGDLHCANVVFAGHGGAMLIDFGDAGFSFSALDPVTMELSTVFHSQHAMLRAGWPTEQNIAQWIAPERFGEGSTFAPFVVACREWALAEGGSPEEVVAVAYAYAVRQLKYADTDKVLAKALIRTCISYLVQ